MAQVSRCMGTAGHRCQQLPGLQDCPQTWGTAGAWGSQGGGFQPLGPTAGTVGRAGAGKLALQVPVSGARRTRLRRGEGRSGPEFQ